LVKTYKKNNVRYLGVIFVIAVISFFCLQNKLMAKDVVKKSQRIVDTGKCYRSKGGYKIYRGSINILKYNQLPYNNGAKSFKKQKLYDDNCIPLHIRHGKIHYHPGALAQYGLHLLDVYITVKDKEYLKKAEKISAKLIGISLAINSSIFFPYNFDFPLHGYKEDTLYAPWYSGMAQGQALSFFIRLYEITKNNSYLQIAKKILNSFIFLDSKPFDPWITCVDQDSYLWVEEYPDDPPAHTLNGMIFGLYGLYDFFRTTKDQSCEKLLRGGIQTIKANIHRFRTVNGISHYCLKHPQIKSITYHDIHIRQLKMIYKITGDKDFLRVSEIFLNDTKNID
jgi:uncharacterized protein YyaL (SSP411 family)